MKCNIMLISREKSFIIDSMMQELKNIGFNCCSAGFDVKEIGKKQEETDVFFLFFNEFDADMMSVLVFVKDICADDSKTLYLAGYEAELEKAKEVIPRELVRKEFLRPFDAKKTVNEINLDSVEIKKKQEFKEILLVDDDITFLKLVKKWLMDKYRVTVVKSGVQAIKYLAAHRPSLIILDYDMPITNGSQVLEMLRSEPDSERIPVIFLTGRSDKETVLQVMSLRPQGYMLKTMSRDDIVSTIDNFFETSKWQNAIEFSEKSD